MDVLSVLLALTPVIVILPLITVRRTVAGVAGVVRFTGRLFSLG